MKEYSYYFFDLFFTLISIEYDCVFENNEFSVLGVSRDEWDKYAKHQYENRALGNVAEPVQMVDDIVRMINPCAKTEEVQKITDLRKARYQRAHTHVKPSILNTIERLYNAGKILVLISNSDCIDKMHWPENPLYKYFHASFFSCDLGLLKPNADIYRKAIETVNADIGGSVFVGDGGHQEFEGAHKVGLKCILTTEFITSTWPELIEDLSKEADYVIQNLQDLLV
jgi:putative hydrolase of the HAD superfamily